MSEILLLDGNPSAGELEDNVGLRKEVEYLGREIIVGRDGNCVVLVSVLTGRSPDSRERGIQSEDQDHTLRTVAPGKT